MGCGFSVLFEAVPDPRAGNARHDLIDLLFIALAATLCGAQSCADMAEFGEAKQGLLRQVLRLPHGVPSHDTFSRVFRLLDPVHFEAAFRRFVEGFAEALAASDKVVALDGKALRGAYEVGARKTPLHLVSAWAADQRLVLGQRRAEGGAEVKATLELVALLRLDGCIVTADALHANRAMTAAVRARGGDYALTLKGNRGPLHRAVIGLFDQPGPAAATTAETCHGRYEERSAWVVPLPPDWAVRHGFADLAAAARIDSLRRGSDGSEQRERRYVVLSRLLEPNAVLRVVRAHWTIENRLHWLLDVVLDEDRARSRKDAAAENLALIRRLALNILQTDPYPASIRRKIKRARWQNSYPLSLIRQMR